jgi:hypothetical protein
MRHSAANHPGRRRGSAARRSACAEALEGRVLLTNWCVSNAGLNSNPGTLARPFQTIQQAANVAKPGDTVLIRGGTYYETVTPPRSGLPGKTINFEVYDGESVTIDGANPITGWTHYSGSIYEASQSWDLGEGNNQVFVNGQMMNEARWPNTTLDVSHPVLAHTTGATSQIANGPNASTATITDPHLTQPAGYWVGATIHIAPGQGWTAQTGTVTAYTPGKLTYTFTSYAPTRSYENPSAGNGYYLTGKFQALDAPGEFYVDSAGHLYLWAPNGGSPVNVQSKVRLDAFNLSGLSYINIIGLNIFASTIVTDASSSHVILSNLNVSYVSQFTIQPVGWELGNPQQSGIQINGTNIILQDSTIAYSAGDGVLLGGSGNTVQKCLIHDTDYNAGDWAPIYVLGSDNMVRHNTVYNAGRSGIVFRYSPDVQILNNLIYDVMLQTTDGGGLYTYGTNGAGSRIAYNVVYDVYAGGYGAAGIYLDNYSSNYLVDHNVVFNTDYALKLNPTNDDDEIYNNTFANSNLGLATSGSGAMNGTVFANDIFAEPADFGPGAVLQHLFTGSNPHFVGGAAGNYLDFKLAAGSPAIDAGEPLPPDTNGYTGNAPDDGAFEYGVGAFVAGTY